MAVYSLLTPTDWFHYFGTSGDAGLARVVDVIATAGVSRLYYRTHEGGKATFPSKAGTTLIGQEIIDSLKGNIRDFYTYPESYFRYLGAVDFTHSKGITAFMDACQLNGMERALWATIMEDDHGGMFKSKFILAHPELRCVNRKGESIDGCLEYWFDEVRTHKLAVIDELLAFKPDRIQIDLVRRNGLPSADVNGYYQYGFNPQIVDGFRKSTGLDARSLEPGSADWQRWLEYAGRPTTEFMIEACRRINAAGAKVDFMMWPVHLKTWMGIDLEAILDTGYVDAIHVASQAYAYSPADLQRQLKALRPQVGDRPVDIVPSISGYDHLLNHALDRFFQAMEENGVKNTVLHESNMILCTRTAERFRALAFGEPHYKRMLKSKQVDRVDWSKTQKLSGFLRGYNASDLKTDQLTEIQVAHTADALHVRVTCHERDVKRLLPVKGWPRDNYNVIQLHRRCYWDPYQSVHLFLCPADQLNDYFHFVLDAAGEAGQERLLDERWEGEWGHEVEIGEKSWTATFHIPFSTLKVTPKAGTRMSVQSLRVQDDPREVSLLTLGNTESMKTDEMGFLELQ